MACFFPIGTLIALKWERTSDNALKIRKLPDFIFIRKCQKFDIVVISTIHHIFIFIYYSKGKTNNKILTLFSY